MNNKLLKLLKAYTLPEQLEILKYRFGNFLIRTSDLNTRVCYHVSSVLVHQGIEVKRKGNHFYFKYPFKGELLNIYLDKYNSDINVFKQVFIREEYAPIVEIIKKNKIELNLMIDGGANIGLTSLYFKTIFPDLKILAFEPSTQSFPALLKHKEKNLFNDMEVEQTGIWSRKTRLAPDYTFRDQKNWSFRLKEGDENNSAFNVLSMHDIIVKYDVDFIDFLKLDIEGGEKEVFLKSSNLNWLKKVKLIAIEVHNEIIERETIKNILISNDFVISNSGEFTIGLNKNFN